MELQSLLMQTKSGKELSEYHLKLLKKQNINTPHEFVTAENLHKLLALSIDQIELIKRELLSLFVARVKFKGLYQKSPLNYATGIKELDMLLDSIGQPLRPGRIWELYGETGLGKTKLIHTLAVNFVCEQNDNAEVLFIDTKSDVDCDHLEDILHERQLESVAIDSCLEKINLIEAPTAQSLITILENFEKQLSTDNDLRESMSRIKLVCIDSLAASFILYRTNNLRNDGRRFLAELAMLLRKLAVQFGIAFILCNLSFNLEKESDGICDEEDNVDCLTQACSDGQENYSLLGEYWSSVCTLALTLELPEDSNDSDGIRLLRVLHNSYGVSEGTCLLRLTDAGFI